MRELIEVNVPQDWHRRRLEDFLFAHFSGLSKMYLRETVRDGLCEVNGRDENVGHRIRANDHIEIRLDLTRANAMRPEDIALDIVFEDQHLVIVNKPAGMLVHPTHRDKDGTLLNALTHHLNKNGHAGLIRPGLVHRLDKQTSGLIVAAKSDRAHRSLSRQFGKKRVEKRYSAIVEGMIDNDEGVIDAPIARYPELKLWAIDPDGKNAETRFWVQKRMNNATLLDLEPVTGRTNQLRIHLAHIGHPIVGDTARGAAPAPRLYLHARRLAFDHPITNERIAFERDPQDFTDGPPQS